MTGWIAGATPPRRGGKNLNPLYRGSNQTGLRATNERLVLSLIRMHGQLSKSQIAEITGLTVQTASVIVRSLAADGLLVANAPMRGKVGQPSIPMSLDPDGALFLGLLLDHRFAELALVDFLGRFLGQWRATLDDGCLDCVGNFLVETWNHLQTTLPRDRIARVQGIGISVSAKLLDDAGSDYPSNASAGGGWTVLDELTATIGRRLDLSVYVQNETISECSAELVYGLGAGIPNFIYVRVGDLVDGSIVQSGQLQFSTRPGSSGIGRMLVPSLDGRLVPLAGLATSICPTTLTASEDLPSDGMVPRLDGLAWGVAHAVHAASSVIALDACIIDGPIPTATRRRLVQAVKSRLGELGGEAALSMTVREGTRQDESTLLGAACLPLLYQLP